MNILLICENPWKLKQNFLNNMSHEIITPVYDVIEITIELYTDSLELIIKEFKYQKTN
jgi:hypothetical protein